MSRPRVFLIGFNRCGTGAIGQHFEDAGYSVRLGQNGRLAEDIAYCAATGRSPLDQWPETQVFGHLERVLTGHRPPIEAHRQFATLHHHFPDAWFILPIRDCKSWLRSRYWHDDGSYRAAWARHLDVPETDLPAIWRRDWSDHLDAARAHFRDSDRLVVLDMDADWAATLSQDVRPDFRLGPATDAHERAPWPALPAPGRPTAARADTDLVNRIADFCTRSDSTIPTTLKFHQHGDMLALWDGGTQITDGRGNALPIAAEQIAGRIRFLAQPNSLPKIDRTEAVLNELAAAGHTARAWIDMQDRRQFGTRATGAPRRPALVYNRLADPKRNCFLWPLPGYHTPGLATYVHAEPLDQIAFADKADSVGWRGNLTGRPNAALAADPGEGRPPHQLLQELTARNDERPEDQPDLARELSALTRYSVAARTQNRPGFDIALALPDMHAEAARNPLIADLCAPRVPPDWFYQHRYVLCLAGRDAGSNFLLAANSRSVVLKEHDGWELFYTDLFQPWQHFIPLAPGATDLDERLDWARANPKACQDMTDAARVVCARLASIPTRKAWLAAIAEAVRTNWYHLDDPRHPDYP